MSPRVRMIQGIIYASLFLITALPIAQEMMRRSDIWWTPFALRVPLAQSADRVEIYVGERPLLPLLQTGRLQLAEPGGARSLGAGDLGLRFNNRDRVRAERMPILLIDALLCGMTGTLLLLMLSGRLAYRPEKTAA